MAICLLPEKIDEFKRALITRKIDIASLLNMESAARTEVLREYAGTNAADVNKLFESKLVLKNRELGIKNALKKITETGKYSPEEKARLDTIKSEWKAAQQERIFSPKENEAFLNALANKATGIELTRDEAKALFELNADTNKKLEAYNPETQEWSSPQAKAEYGATKVAYEKYFEYLKDPQRTIKQMVGDRIGKFKEEFKDNPGVAIKNMIMDTVGTISDNTISMVATLDNSFLGRQGLRTLYTHPSAWWNGAKNSFVDIAKTLGGAETIDALMADIYSRPNYLNGQYHDSGILNKNEEQFPTSFPERIPVLGRALKASEAAFKGSGIRMRTDLYDLITNIGTEQGVDFNDKKESQAVGDMINSLTARGKLTPGVSKTLRLVLWAPKMLKSHIDVLTDPLLAKSSFARKQAAINLMKIIGVMSLIMLIANALKPGSAETDPTSSDFGKIKIGNTRFDYTGGAASLATLAARLIRGGKKSTTTGKFKGFSSGFGQATAFSTVVDFLTNKTTPPVGSLIDFMKGIDRDFQKPTVTKEFYRNVTPIFVQNAIKLKDDSSVEAILGVIADGVGISANTYQPLHKK